MKKKKSGVVILVFVVLLIANLSDGQTIRLKDIAKFRGARDNQLFGVGLVVGLNGTGDSTVVPSTLAANMLKNFGMNFSASELKSKNSAIVMVTADIPPFYKEGMRLDVTVSSLGDAKSLSGGVLLQTPLYGADGKVYAVAQGPLSIGGEDVGQTVNLQKRHQLVAYIPQGAIVEKEIPMEIVSDNSITLMLNRPDFTTAARAAQAINTKFESPLAKAVDAASIKVKIPKVFEDDIITFLAIVEEIEIVPDAPAKIVVNERTGTIVFGGKIEIQNCVISYGNFNVSIKSTGDNTVESLVNALKASGATPQDIIAILQALRQSGALQVELIVM
ncbi:MAG TPA: flagellar basal body P-ring protein FlgI [Thermotogaceae bacterium]|nr:flagellar basal body P-ring protein FlgI [Thermotogota bacterium]HEW92464.1 flagellar basal body P-ring protein FlgI [Thermotogaceae bacterium]